MEHLFLNSSTNQLTSSRQLEVAGGTTVATSEQSFSPLPPIMLENPNTYSIRAKRQMLTLNRDNVNVRFGKRLRELRYKGELTQLDVAKKFGIDRSFISDVERGKKSISLPLLEVIALGFEISLSELFKDL